MSQADTGAGPKGVERPLSPHLQVWRWHVTMAGSILHRATGVALYLGALVTAGWTAALAAGPDAYARYLGFLACPIGKLVLIGFTFAIFFHLANGLRHLAWDLGVGFRPRTADASGIAVIAFAVVATIAVWVMIMVGAS